MHHAVPWPPTSYNLSDQDVITNLPLPLSQIDPMLATSALQLCLPCFLSHQLSLSIHSLITFYSVTNLSWPLFKTPRNNSQLLFWLYSRFSGSNSSNLSPAVKLHNFSANHWETMQQHRVPILHHIYQSYSTTMCHDLLTNRILLIFLYNPLHSHAAWQSLEFSFPLH